ncbi:unnamed protein product [Rhizopus stolonifer]
MYSSFKEKTFQEPLIVDENWTDTSAANSPLSPHTPQLSLPIQLFTSISSKPMNTSPIEMKRMVSFDNQSEFNKNNSEKNATLPKPSELNPFRERSSSIGSIVSVSHPPVRKSSLVDKDDHLITLKNNFQLFKKPASTYVSIKDIKQGGLKVLLLSTAPLSYFLYYLMTEYSSENLFFYLIADNYQQHMFSSQIERYYAANKIANDYLTSSSELEVNLDDRTHKLVKRALEQQRRTLISSGKEFDAAKRHVFSLLNSNYHRFRTTSIWNIMEARCTDAKSCNSERLQGLIVNLLLTYTNHNKNKYSQEISKLVHSFCLVHLPLGYQLLTTPKKQEHKKHTRMGSPFDLIGKKFHLH